MIPDVASIESFLDPGHVDFAERIARFADEAIRPLPEPSDDDEARVQAREILDRLGGEWLAPVREQAFRPVALAREALAAASPLADAVYALQALGGTPFALCENAELRSRWLPPIADGRAMAAFAMTEPDAGSDVSAIATIARREGEGWVLDGEKTLISNAGIADVHVVFATADPDAGHRGIACFAVQAGAEGLAFAGPQVLSAPHPLGRLRFDGCRVGDAAVLAGPGEGFKLGLATLDRLRATVGAAACGMAGRALQESLDHALERRQFGEPIAAFQLVREKLARMATELAAARLLVYRAVREVDRGAGRVTIESAMAKAFACEAAQRIVDEAVQIHGGSGVLADSVVDRLYRSVRALRIYEGTTEIQRLLIADRLLEDGA